MTDLSALRLPEPVNYEKVYGDQGGIQGSIAHRLTFAEHVNRAQVVKYLESVQWYGYDPCGYGGMIEPREQVVGRYWIYHHSRTTGD